ncbi:MAG TPA: phospho-N-acetylmuramoyl-pentapeptide-transferase [Aquifex aeolicus]|nr:phospho-N-acetylmuramoyl-pentapeptide-transferase [Aquificales bacterium]HIQ26615.1 phospho-N-acetylmuramoyl-pentapeptide-transferase [Aquifex aeolicus]
MLYHLGEWLKEVWFPFNVLHYISFRSFLAFLLAFATAMVLIPLFTRFMKKIHTSLGGYQREYLTHHAEKRETPSMGGVVLVLILVFFSFLFLRWDKPYFLLCPLTLLLFGLIGFVDDLFKLFKNQPQRVPVSLRGLSLRGGLTAKQKLFFQFIFAFFIAYLLLAWVGLDTNLYFPLLKDLYLDLGTEGFLIFATLFIVFFSNAVNLTDGLDGLAIGVTLTTFAVGSLIAYLAGNKVYAEYLGIPYVPYVGELTILAMTFLGAGLAFLWYNTHPAKIFMGDVGSLALGALLALFALLTKSEFLFLIAGGVFVAEALSVIIQVGVCKLTKRRLENGKTDCKRVFLMAPLHHHFEKKGWKEEQIVVRLWIVSVLLGVFSLMFLKLR